MWRRMPNSSDDGGGEACGGARPEPLKDYPGGPHDTTLLTRYHVHVARKASEGVVHINVCKTLM